MDGIALFGYRANTSWPARLSASSKLLFLLMVTTVGMMSFDTRLLVALCVLAFIVLIQARIRFKDYRVLLALMCVFLVLNLIAVYLFAPKYGVQLYSSETELLGHGMYALTTEQLFYELNMFLKYVLVFPLTITFFLTTNPSEFAAELSRIGVPYKICYAVEIALRYIPDIQSEYHAISLATQARGYDMSRKVGLGQRVKGAARIIMPLVFSSLDRVDTVSHAMELRRFGLKRRRTWYRAVTWRTADTITVIVGVLIVVIAIVLLFVNGGRYYNPFI